MDVQICPCVLWWTRTEGLIGDSHSVRKCLGVRKLYISAGNNHSIGSFFKHKERLPLHLCSGVIYKFECESCKALYIGSTTRQLKCRAFEHLGTSVRSGNPLSVPPFSSIKEHRDKSGHPFSLDNFTIRSKTNHILLVMESLYIYKKRC